MKLLATVTASALAASWEYPETFGVDGSSWGDECTDQVRGSPIDLDYTYRNFHFMDCAENWNMTGYDQQASWNFADNEHTIVLTSDDYDAKFSGGHIGNEYQFHSFHFHWGDKAGQGGSEHTINGHHTFAEVHFVHYRSDIDLVTGLGLGDGLAVLGFMIEVTDGDESNEAIGELARRLRWHSNKQGNEDGSFRHFDFSISNLIEGVDLSNFYRYEGSLTTPPCSEAVQWTVFKDPIRISRQTAANLLRSADLADEHIEDNFRPVQPLADRNVIFYSDSSAAFKAAFRNERNFDREREFRDYDWLNNYHEDDHHHDHEHDHHHDDE
ncbi:Oidioi.mRNA.OKI2018_I69.PAR.g10039.t1.cds [Oikopleura dioica]|uniref:carbonic anhydrase n=1 Tax=Oikopleura dioica TaxID=34765 RepID=A0ABN7RRP3_OIKDI|nr:Oidioi.mRNA.OKI2018_I69.PAR.g10039.t1.cds [Oikopleura dioica]